MTPDRPHRDARSSSGRPSASRLRAGKRPLRIDLSSQPASPPPTADFTDYDGALAHLYSRVDLERLRPSAEVKDQYKLDRMRALAAALGNPQDDLRCVHVAGTKGKGSVCEMTAAALEANGCTVGLYTSPHILDVRERIRVNRQPISREDFLSLARECVDAAVKLEAVHGPATFFELTTLMSFLHFARQAVDVAVIEVGLGGLLDCTNIIVPQVAAIAHIGLDHTQILGDTVEQIALQKAGIMKPGVPTITHAQDEAVMKVLREHAAAVGSPLSVLGADIEFTSRTEAVAGSSRGPVMRVHFTTQRFDLEHVTVPLRGEHQANNCGLALAIVDRLCDRGVQCTPERIVRGLESVKMSGRFEIAVQSPRVVLDGAHNVDSVKALVRTLSTQMQYDSLVVVFGCAADKDYASMLRALAGGADKVIFTRATGSARAATPVELARKYHEVSGGKMCQTARDFNDAMQLALSAVNRDDVLCITGSFYIVGEAKRWLSERLAKKK